VIDAVTAGETFIVTRNCVSIAEPRPLRPNRRTIIPKAEIFALAASGPHGDTKQFQTELDRIADSITARRQFESRLQGGR